MLCHEGTYKLISVVSVFYENKSLYIDSDIFLDFLIKPVGPMSSIIVLQKARAKGCTVSFMGSNAGSTY